MLQALCQCELPLSSLFPEIFHLAPNQQGVSKLQIFVLLKPNKVLPRLVALSNQPGVCHQPGLHCFEGWKPLNILFHFWPVCKTDSVNSVVVTQGVVKVSWAFHTDYNLKSPPRNSSNSLERWEVSIGAADSCCSPRKSHMPTHSHCSVTESLPSSHPGQDE